MWSSEFSCATKRPVDVEFLPRRFLPRRFSNLLHSKFSTSPMATFHFADSVLLFRRFVACVV